MCDILVILKLKYGCDLIRYNEVCREFCKLVEIIFQGMVIQEMDLMRFDKGVVDVLIEYVINRYLVIIDLF